MNNNKEARISYWAAHLTTVVSVTLALLLTGIIAMISIGASNETRRLRERLEVSAVLADTVTDESAHALAAQIASLPWTLDTETVTKRQALERWKQDTGEDLEALFGANPLSPEISFTVNAAWSSADSLRKIAAAVSPLPGVNEVVLPDTGLVESMNRNIETLAIVLAAVALAMTVISFVLINNTVRLAVYARRFTIHTMQLVGATDGFIRRPFVGGNLLAGLLAGLIASAILALALAAAPRAGFPEATEWISWPQFAVTAGALPAAGALICALAAWLATSRHLRRDYASLFR